MTPLGTTTTRSPGRPAWAALLGGDLALRIAAGLMLALVWEGATALWAPAYVARPSGIIRAFPAVITSGALWQAAGQTALAILQGLAIAIVVGTLIGLAIGRIPLVARLLQPYVSGLFAMPMVAILPLLSLFFGYTNGARLATVVFAAIFAIIVNVSDGARSVPPEYIEVSRAFRSSGWARLRDVVLPSSVPYLLAGVRLALGRALIGAVLAEFYAALPGLGYYILFNTRIFHHNEAFIAVAILAVTCVVLEFGLGKATRKALPWYRRDEPAD